MGLTGIILTTASILLVWQVPESTAPVFLSSAKFTTFVQFADFLLLGLILYFGIKFKNRVISGLSLVQILVLGVFEFVILKGDHTAPAGLFCDNLSLIMVLLISIAGSLIAFYALPYMDHHEHHLKLSKSRQPRFFALLFLFIGAMNALVLVNDLMLFYFCFEVTTLCSFLLIGHDRTDEAQKNAATALWINSLGGVALLAGILLIYNRLHTLDIQVIIGFIQEKQLRLLDKQLCQQDQLLLPDLQTRSSEYISPGVPFLLLTSHL